MFAALRVRNYRLYAVIQLFATTASWVQRIAVDWLVFELTGSVTAVGFIVVVQYGPTLLLGMWGGVIVDRYEVRRLVMAAQAFLLAASGVLALLTFTGAVQVWHLFVVAAAVGLVQVVDEPARRVFVSELVDQSLLRTAISTEAAIFQTASMIGPAISGVLLVVAGGPWVFAVTAGFYAVSLTLLLFIDRGRLLLAPSAPRAKGQVVEALRYVRRKPIIFWTLLLLVFVAGIGLNWPVVLAPMSEDVFGAGASGYGVYNSALAAGALIGAFVSMRRTTLRLRSYVFAVLGFSGFKLLAAAAGVEWVFVALLALSGMCLVLMWTSASSLIQLSSNRAIRGRVMALYLLIAIGGQALGGPILGVVTTAYGARIGMAFSAAVPLLAALAIAMIFASRIRRRRSA
ncbi:MAG: MFS transporter [Leucobacter sp.]